MNKQEFLKQLGKSLSDLPRKDVAERLTFYSEMIDDRMDEGLSEEEAVCSIGSVDEIVAQATGDFRAVITVEETVKQKRKWKAWEVVLIVLGSPLWLVLLIAAFAVVFSLYVSLWSIIVSLWSVFASLVACSAGGVLVCIAFTASGNGASGVAVIAASFVCAGLSIFAFYGCKAATKGISILAKKTAIWMKNCFARKGEVE